MAYNYISIERLRQVTDNNTKLIIDADQIAFISASSCEETSVEVTHIASGKKKKFGCKTEFYGAGKKVIGGWLGDQNTMREAKGLHLFSKDEFTIEDKQRIKKKFHKVNGEVDRKKPYSDEELMIYSITATMKNIIEHLGFIQENVIAVLGSGETFRHEMPLPEKYKSNRTNRTKPLLLSTAKQVLIDHFNAEVVTGIEADDRVSQYGYQGWLDYKRTGKFSYVVATMDKDANHTPSLIFNIKKEDKSYLFKNPLPYLVDESVGEIWLEKGKIKGWGTYWMATQLLLGDDSDHVKPYQPFGIKFGNSSCYKYLVQAKTRSEIFKLVVDKYKEWFPEGVKYTSFDGREINLTYAQWANVIFRLIYMQRWDDDKTTLSAYLKEIGVIAS